MKTKLKPPRWIQWALLSYTLSIILPLKAYPFCGFYVGKADAELFNEASQVVMARNGNRTVISMMNDYKGELKEFALVVPVPVILKEGQVNVGDRRMIQHLDRQSELSAQRFDRHEGAAKLSCW